MGLVVIKKTFISVIKNAINNDSIRKIDPKYILMEDFLMISFVCSLLRAVVWTTLSSGWTVTKKGKISVLRLSLQTFLAIAAFSWHIVFSYR